MQPNLFITLLFSALALLAAAPAAAETPASSPASAPARQATQSILTVQTIAIALPHTEAILFPSSVDLAAKPAEALAALQKLVTQRKATAVGNLFLIARSGQRSVAESKKRSLNVEPVLSPDGKTADINFLLTDNSHRISTSFVVGVPGVKFLGSKESSTDPALTEFVFARVSQ